MRPWAVPLSVLCSCISGSAPAPPSIEALEADLEWNMLPPELVAAVPRCERTKLNIPIVSCAALRPLPKLEKTTMAMTIVINSVPYRRKGMRSVLSRVRLRVSHREKLTMAKQEMKVSDKRT